MKLCNICRKIASVVFRYIQFPFPIRLHDSHTFFQYDNLKISIKFWLYISFKSTIKLKMSKEGLKDLLETPQVVQIIKKFSLSIKTEIKKILNIKSKNNISVDLVSKIPIGEYGRKQQDQISKYTILKNGAYYVHHDWYNNQKLRRKVVVPCPRHRHEECGFKLFIQTFIYKLLPKRGGVSIEVDFDVIW